MSDARDRFDVAVVGAGPAGAALARRLARAGVSVVLLERSGFDRPRVGESLSPAVQPRLRQLGLWDRFTALAPLPSWGTRSIWGEPLEQSHSHIVSPYGCGWHVDRCAFDRMLADAALEAGAALRLGTTVQRCRWVPGWWELEVRRAIGRPDASIRARVVVDATGRRAQIGRQLGAGRVVYDRLVGVAVVFDRTEPEQRGCLLVEAAASGWWYSAPLPDPAHDAGRDAMMVMLMTDADLCAAERLRDDAQWHRCRQQARATCARLAGASPSSAPQVHVAQSQRLERNGADAGVGPWLAIGDAALAVDPVSGSGVIRALDSAHAAEAIVVDLMVQPGRAPAILDQHAATLAQSWLAYLLERAAYYGNETRFETPFWMRRRGARDTMRHHAVEASPAVGVLSA